MLKKLINLLINNKQTDILLFLQNNNENKK